MHPPWPIYSLGLLRVQLMAVGVHTQLSHFTWHTFHDMTCLEWIHSTKRPQQIPSKYLVAVCNYSHIFAPPSMCRPFLCLPPADWTINKSTHAFRKVSYFSAATFSAQRLCESFAWIAFWIAKRLPNQLQRNGILSKHSL